MSAHLDLPKPKPFHITKPTFERGLWCFWLTADDDILELVRQLECIMTPRFGGVLFGRSLTIRAMFAFNPRYDQQETWDWLVEFLKVETDSVKLRDSWEGAINSATNKN